VCCTSELVPVWRDPNRKWDFRCSNAAKSSVRTMKGAESFMAETCFPAPQRVLQAPRLASPNLLVFIMANDDRSVNIEDFDQISTGESPFH
jgi:hypothetical protein